jgi:nicotinamidase-related amidase
MSRTNTTHSADGHEPVLKGPRAASSLLAAEDSVVALIDYQGMMVLGVESHPLQRIFNNAIGLAKTAKLYGVPTVLTSAGAQGFAGPPFPELAAVFPDQEVIDRTTLNPWEDRAFVEAIEATGRRKLVVSGLWTEVCVAFPVLSALEAGYDVYVAVDACGGVDRDTHDAGLRRMVEAGAVLGSWLGIMSEWQRDWTRYQNLQEGLFDLVQAHAGSFARAVSFEFGLTASGAGKR